MHNAEIKYFEDNDELGALNALVGKKIHGFGRAAGVEGGLTIDYEEIEGAKVKRIILGYNDLGTWIVWHGVTGVPSSEDILKEKIKAVLDSNVLFEDNPEIQDTPRERRYSFSVNGTEKLSLSIADLKTMPESIRKHFQYPDPKDVEAVVSDLSMYAYS